MKNFRQLTEFRLFFWHLVNKYVTDAWQVDAEEVTLNEEFSVLIKHKVEEIILHLMEESFREGIQQSVLENHKVGYLNMYMQPKNCRRHYFLVKLFFLKNFDFFFNF